MSQTAAAYLASLPEVETVRMPTGTLFVANGSIYQVVETTGGGFSKARQWRRDESTDVALVPGSFLTKTLPLVKTGRILPVYRSRVELTDNGQPTGFIFPTETLAKDAAYLDTALIMSAGAYVRNHHQEPGFAATDGTQIFRLYYFVRSAHGRPTHLTSNIVENPHCELVPHTEGPLYWRLLSSWKDAFPLSKATQHSMSSVKDLHSLDLTDPTITQVAHRVRKEDIHPEQNADVTQASKAVTTDDSPDAAEIDDTRPSH
jgi:hypothetical protein